MASSFRSILCLLCLLLAMPGMAAQLRYLGSQSQPEMGLRAGPDAQQPIIRSLPGGTPVQVQEAAIGGWSKVQTLDGTVGWVMARNLMAQPPAHHDTPANLATTDSATPSPAQTEQALHESQIIITRLMREKESLSRQLEMAHEGLKLSDANQQLREQTARMQLQLQGLEEQIEQLADRSRQDWFITGAGVLLAGIVVGLLIPRLRPRTRRDRW